MWPEHEVITISVVLKETVVMVPVVITLPDWVVVLTGTLGVEVKLGRLVEFVETAGTGVVADVLAIPSVVLVELVVVSGTTGVVEEGTEEVVSILLDDGIDDEAVVLELVDKVVNSDNGQVVV